MKPAKSRLIIAAVILYAVLGGASVAANNAEDQDTPPDTASYPAALDSMPTQAQLPTLKIGGKENPDVYLQSLDIQVEVTGNIAATRHTMVFKNRTNRISEGVLTFPLPDGRSVTHYALDINGKMRDGVPVEKARGTQVFEEIERRRVDPGLLERVEGNNFRTRVYPIPAKGTRTISIGYEEELTFENGLMYCRLPVTYSDSLENFAIKATVLNCGQKPLVPKYDDDIRFEADGENYIASFVRKNYRPSRPLIFALPAPVDTPQVLTQSAQGSFYFLASVAPKIEPREKRWNDNLAIIWDVSLSGSQRNLKREIEMLDVIFAEKKNANVNLYFLNNKNVKIGAYNVVDGNWDTLKNVLETAVFDGGTDFSQININNVTGNEILFFSDGISTLSDADFLKNVKANRPIHCIISSAKADYSAMKSIADRTKGKFINVNALSSEKLKNELQYETPRFLGTEHGNNVREVYPGIAAPIHGNFSIAGISKTNNAELTLLFGFGNKVEKRIKIQLDAKKAAAHGNIYKIWAQKKIAELDLDHEKNRAKLTELGRQFGIVTRNTSLIVLENVGDYVQYGIEPPASEPELLAEYRRGRELKGVAVMNRGGDWDSRRELNTSSPDFMRAGALTGDRKEADIQRVVTQNIAALRHAYRKRLRDKPALAGTITVRFFVNEFGKVTSAQALRSTINDHELEDTVLTRVKSWNFDKFDKPGDLVEVIYPFAFYDGEDTEQTRKEAAQTKEFVAQAKKEAAAEEARKEEEWIARTAAANATVTLDGAAAAARNLKIWWNIDFTPAPAKFKSHKPGDSVTVDDMFSENGGSVIFNKIDSAKILTKKDITKPDYMKTLTGELANDYQRYLKLRNDHASSPVFYFDMSNWFYTRGDRETALRVLTSIADLEIENASLYRLLGYRFKEYGEYALEKFVCKKVVQWRPMEPQSYRDYALALADNGEAQAALDALDSLLKRPYSDDILNRTRGMVEVIAAEINHLIAKNPRLNTSKIDKRLRINFPVDVRVVINWNMDNTDIDLHVKDPNGEECYYSSRLTGAGGRVSNDITSGYGPEQFILKRAIKGKYRIYVNYYGDSQFTSAGPPTVMAEIYTKYADKTERRKVVSLQMSNAKKGEKMAEVAEFDF